MDVIPILEANYKSLAKTAVIVNKVYPVVAKAFETNKNAVKKAIGEYITSRYTFLYAVAPYDRLSFGKEDYDKFWRAIKLNEKQIDNLLRDCFFYNINYNPRSAKAPFTAVLFCCLRYCLKHNDQKNAELMAVYLAFSGQFYPSNHSGLWPYLPNKEALEYVVNNKLSGKYDIKKYSNVFDSIRNICIVWIERYRKDITSESLDDDSYGTIIQQLHDREKSFLKNIAKEYYDNKDNYMNYVRNNMDPDNYLLQDNNASLANKFTEMAVDYLTTRDVDYRHCSMVADENVKKDEVKSIMSSILHDKKNMPEIRELINIIITDYMKTYPDEPVSSVKFLTYSMATKPNSKDKYIIREREIITRWLTNHSVDYMRRKSRQSTATSYYKCILKMIVLGINAAVK